MKGKQTLPPWWPELTRIVDEKVGELTRIVPENDSNKPYMLHIKRNGEVILNVNLACRHALDLMFDGNYAEAVFEHENAHPGRTKYIGWQIDPNSSLIVMMLEVMRTRYYEFSALLAEMTRDSIANAVLGSQSLQQFLEFEVCKIGDLEARLPFVLDNFLWLTEVRLCGDMRSLSINGLEANSSAMLRQSWILQDIHEGAYPLFKKAWLASQQSSPTVDLSVETQTLLSYVREHPIVLSERMRA